MSLAGALVLSGCAGVSVEKQGKVSRQESTAKKLRLARAKIESLKERNQILRMRLKMLTRNGSVGPLGESVGESAIEPAEALKGFEQGIVTDVPLDSKKPQPKAAKEVGSKPEKGVLDLRAIPTVKMASRLPTKVSLKRREAANRGVRLNPRVHSEMAVGEQADRALLRTMLGQLRLKDDSSAERTLRLLEKSYPDSQVLGEARFQMGLHHYRSRKATSDGKSLEKALRSADFYFAEALRVQLLEPRVQAGSALMRGVIARLLLHAGGEVRNREVAQQNFEFVMKKYPRTMEARRAKRELAAMDRRTL